MTRTTSRCAAVTAVALSASLSVGALALTPAAAQRPPGTVELQVLGITDFHGHLDPGAGTAPSVAGVLGGAVQALRAQNRDTVLVSSGDNIGASPFVSSSQQDEPTIDVLDAMGLAVSAVGNHELDRGAADLAERVVPRADVVHLGANVVGETPDLPEHEVVRTPSGVAVGFVGVVTEQTATLVPLSRTRGVRFTDPVAAANHVADALSDGDTANGEADVVVLLAHEGARSGAAAVDTCGELAAADDAFADLVRGVDADVDAVLGGHTHVTVDCHLPLPDGQLRPVLQAGAHGTALARLRLTWDTTSRRLVGADADVVPLAFRSPTPPPFRPDPAIEALVDDAETRADVAGGVVVGEITQDIPRAKTAGGAEDRGSESLLGGFLADVQLAATDGPDEGGAHIAFVHPGALRADLLRDDQDRDEAVGQVTYAEAAAVQPFANRLLTLALTGAQVERVLEEQYQPAGATRPFLALGVSKGLRYELDGARPVGSRVQEVTLDGVPLDRSATYRIALSSSLASRTDGFPTLAGGTDRRDTGLDELPVLVEHLRARSPVTPDSTARAVVLSTPSPTPTAAPPRVRDGPATERLAGDDRDAAAAAVVRDAFPTGPVPVVLVANGERSADGLAGGPAADVLGGPVLPVPSVDALAPIRGELIRLRPERIVVLGGPAAVSATTAAELQGFTSGTVTRLAGADRYATAARIATSVFSAPVRQVLVATATGAGTDALAAATAGARTDTPVLLVSRTGVPTHTLEALRVLQPRRIAVVGGTDAVTPAVLERLRGLAGRGAVTRLGGPDRYATAARSAQAFWPETYPVVHLSNGRASSDALAGVPAAGRASAPLLLVEPTCMPASTRRQLDRLRPTTVVVLGGEQSVSRTAAAGRAC